MQEQTEGVGQKAVTAEPVGVKAVLELFDAVFAFAAIVVKAKTSTAPPAQLVMRKRRLVPVAVCSAL